MVYPIIFPTLYNQGWEDNWVYHKQIFTRNGEVYAIGITKVGFWKKHKIQNMRDIIKESGIETKEMKVPLEILNLFKEDYNMLKHVK